MKKLFFSLAAIALAVASAAAAANYRVTLFQPSVVGSTELKPGDYKMEVTDNKVLITAGKTSVEAPVKVETADEKYPSTSVRYASGDGKYKIMEIRIGGTKTRLVFTD